MKYWDVIRVGAKTSAPTQPAMAVDPYKETKETIEDLCDQVQNMLIQLRDCKNGVSSTETTLNDEELRTVISTVCEYHDKYFPTIEMRSTLDPAFMYNIPKNVYNASQMMRAREYPVVLDPLFWFFIFMTADLDQYSMSKIYTTAGDLAYNVIGDLETITKYADGYDEYIKDFAEIDRDDDEIADGEIVEPVDDVDLGSEAEHVEEAISENESSGLIISPPEGCKHFEYDESEDDTHVVSLNTDEEDDDYEPNESDENNFVGMLLDEMEGIEND